MVKNLPVSYPLDPGPSKQVGKIPWRRKWQLTPVLLTGKSHGQKSLGLQSRGLQKRQAQPSD